MSKIRQQSQANTSEEPQPYSSPGDADCQSMYSTHTSYRRLLSPQQSRQQSRLGSPSAMPQHSSLSRNCPTLRLPLAQMSRLNATHIRAGMQTQRTSRSRERSRNQARMSEQTQTGNPRQLQSEETHQFQQIQQLQQLQYLQQLPTSHMSQHNSQPVQQRQPIQRLQSALSKLELRVTQARQQLEKRNLKGRQEVTTGSALSCRQKSMSPPHNGQSTITVKKIPGSQQGGEIRTFNRANSIVKIIKPYYVTEALKQKYWKRSDIKDHIGLSIEILSRLEDEQPPQLDYTSSKIFHFPRKEFYKYKKTLVFEIDQTLIYCGQNSNSCDAKIQLRTSRFRTIPVNIRPYATRLLKQMSEKFEIIAFTTRERVSALAIIDFLDPEGNVFQHKLFQQHCWKTRDGDYIKDLRVLERDLAETILVDSSASSFAFQIQNGIPILPYHEGNQDNELKSLMEYLQQLQTVADVRQVNRKTFKLQHYSKFKRSQQLIEELYCDFE